MCSGAIKNRMVQWVMWDLYNSTLKTFCNHKVRRFAMLIAHFVSWTLQLYTCVISSAVAPHKTACFQSSMKTFWMILIVPFRLKLVHSPFKDIIWGDVDARSCSADDHIKSFWDEATCFPQARECKLHDRFLPLDEWFLACTKNGKRWNLFPFVPGSYCDIPDTNDISGILHEMILERRFIPFLPGSKYFATRGLPTNFVLMTYRIARASTRSYLKLLDK